MSLLHRHSIVGLLIALIVFLCVAWPELYYVAGLLILTTLGTPRRKRGTRWSGWRGIDGRGRL